MPWTTHLSRSIRGINPFTGGNVLPSRVPLFAFSFGAAAGRPTLPFPHPWNYHEPMKIFEAFYHGAEKEPDSAARHNRYLYVAGLPPVLLTRDPAVIKAILSSTGDKPGQFDRDTQPTAGIGRATGVDSLLYANGAVWKRQKRLSAEPFSKSNLFQPEKFHGFEQTFRRTVAERLALLRDMLAKSGQKTARISLESEIQVVMLEMLVNNFFGASITYEDLRARYVPALVALIEHMISDTVAPRLHALKNRLTGRDKVLKQYAADFETLTDIALSGRKEGRGLWAQFQSDASNDALRANIRVFLAGAMEATTSFATWALSHLARAPHIQEQIFTEIRDMQEYDPDNLAKAVTLNRVLEETLRLTPSLYFFPRRATVDTTLEVAEGKTMFIPDDTCIRLDVWHANRCEEFWGESISGHRADVFAPERWDVLAAKGITSRDMLHFGFGHGPRFCPGRYLGLLEVGLVVGAIVKMFKFSPVHQALHARAGVSTKPADGVLVDLALRE